MTPRQVFNAEETIREWLGEGGQPAPNAQARADTCSGRLSGKVCPYNFPGKWLMPEAIANTVQRWIEAKTNLKLEVQGEDKLGWCELCSCKLSLKVQVPLRNILNHTPENTLAGFRVGAPWCWLNTEQNNNSASK